MAKRRSKWRRTWQVVKKMMQEARRVKAYESLRQCPVCGNPHSLSISIKTDKSSEKKSAEVVCSACGFEHEFEEIPSIADEFWVYSKVLDTVHGRSVEERKVDATIIESSDRGAGFHAEESEGASGEEESKVSIEFEEETD